MNPITKEEILAAVKEGTKQANLLHAALSKSLFLQIPEGLQKDLDIQAEAAEQIKALKRLFSFLQV